MPTGGLSEYLGGGGSGRAIPVFKIDSSVSASPPRMASSLDYDYMGNSSSPGRDLGY